MIATLAPLFLDIQTRPDHDQPTEIDGVLEALKVVKLYKANRPSRWLHLHNTDRVV